MAAPELKVQISAEAQNAIVALGQLSSAIAKLSGEVKKTGNETASVGTSMAGSFFKASLAAEAVQKAIGAIKNAASSALTDIIQNGLQYEKVMRTLQFATGDSAGSMAFVKKVSNDLGQDLLGTAESYGKLAASARGTSLEGTKIRGVFESVAQASAVMGLSSDETKGALMALSQMVSKGKVQAEELRGQLGERLPGAFQISARAMGMTTSELSKALELGKVYADDFLPKFAAQLKKELGDAPLSAAQSFRAAIQRAQNAWTEFTIDVGKDGFSKVLQDGLQVAGGIAMEALGYVRVLIQEFSGWASDLLPTIKAWFSEHKEDITSLMESWVLIAKQVGGLIGDLAGILFKGSQISSVLGGIAVITKTVAVTFGLIRDVIQVAWLVLQSMGTTLKTAVLYPTAWFLEAIAWVFEKLGKSDWASTLKAKAAGLKESVGKSLDSVGESAERVGKIFSGDGAMGQALEEALNGTKLLGAEAVRTKKKVEDIDKGFKPPDDKKKAAKDLVTHAESLARISKLQAEGAEKNTLEARKTAEWLKVQADMEADIAKLQEEKAKGKFKRAGGGADFQAELQAHQNLYAQRLSNIDEKYAREREKLEEQLQSDLVGQEEGGLGKRLDAVAKHFAKIRELNRNLGGPISEDQIAQAEAARRERERLAQVKEDVGKLKQELAELAEIKGRALSMGEQAEVMDRFALKSKEAAEAVGRVRKEMHIGEGGVAGFKAALFGFVLESQNAFERWKNTTTTIMQGMQSAFASFFQSIFEKGKTGAQKWDALWKGIASTVVGALAQMAAQWLVASIAQALFAESTNAASAAKISASYTEAVAASWAAYAGIPYFGWALAVAQIAAITSSISGSAAVGAGLGARVTARATGGLVNRPELTLLGEAGPEIVAPQQDFLAWSSQLQLAGANLAFSISARERAAQRYEIQAAGYSSAAYGAMRGGQPSSSSGRTEIHVHGDVYAQDSQAFEAKVTKAVRKYESRRA